MSDKLFLRGFFLALSLIVVQKPCIYIMAANNFSPAAFFVIGAIFAIIQLYFLTSKKLLHFFAIGLTGLLLLFFGEFVLSESLNSFDLEWYFSAAWFDTYVAGLYGSAAGVALAMVCTIKKISFSVFTKNKEVTMNNTFKMKLLLYTLISAVTVSYLVLPQNAGISIPVFTVIQFTMLWFVVPNRKKLWLYVPIFILSLNYFISGNEIWRLSNVLVGIILYSVLFVELSFKETANHFLVKIFDTMLDAFPRMHLPFVWTVNSNKEKAPIIRRVLIGLAISIPCMIFLIIMLSNADMVFNQGVNHFFDSIFASMRISAVLKILTGVLTGLYLFGLVYNAYQHKEEQFPKPINRQGDLIILNILLASVLIIYTIFVVIQFRYLFARTTLPYGLTYSEYARKGFFELLTLTGVNIALIVFVVYLTKQKTGIWGIWTKGLLCYLCSITIILLISSYYRMWLYNYDDGLTRLRFLVFGFLMFETLGLMITFFYILKPRFNIIMVYLSIGLTYYLVLNVVPMDYYVAKSQIDRYFNTQTSGIAYTLTLSVDAAPQVKRLLESNDEEITMKAREYFEKHNQELDEFIPRWQRYNTSTAHFRNIYTQTLKQ